MMFEIGSCNAGKIKKEAHSIGESRKVLLITSVVGNVQKATREVRVEASHRHPLPSYVHLHRAVLCFLQRSWYQTY